MPVDSVWFPRMENLPAVFLFPEKQWRWTPPDLLVEEMTEETIEDDETTEEAMEAAVAGRRRRCWLRTTL